MLMVAVAFVASAVETLLAFSQSGLVDIFVISLSLQTIAIVAALLLHAREQIVNRVASTVLLLFWFATVLVSLMRLRTSVTTGLAAENSPTIAATVAYMTSSLVTLVLECQPKPRSLFRSLLGEDYEDGSEYFADCPEERAHFFSRLTFSWMTPLLEKGYRDPLQFEDIWDLATEYRPDVVTDRFQQNWQRELSSTRPSLLRATIRTYREPWIIGGILKLVRDLISFLNPILLSRLIGFVSKYGTPEAQPVEYGYFYVISMFVVASLQTLTLEQHWYQNMRIKSMMMSGYSTAIYRKTLILSNDSRQKYNTGGIVTHMSVDSYRILDFVGNYSHNMWSAPLQIVLALFLLYRTIGWSMLAGVAVMLVSIPASTHLSRIMRKMNKLLMGHRDKRMKMMDEVLSGIKIIKLYAWESSFIRRISDVRNRLELATIKRYGFLQAIFSFVMTLVPFAVSFSTFGLYSLADGVSHGPLTPQLVFVSLTLFNMLRTPLTQCSTIIPRLNEAIVSFHRIYSFLTAGEIDFAAIEHAPYDRESLSVSHDNVLVNVKQGSFKWLSTDEHPALSNVNLKCRRTELVAVIGRVGSGKSSLMSAILGDMVKCSGKVTICGKVAYVPQQPWIMNATLRDNILFGHRFDQEFYDRVIDACALGPDLEMLPGGDLTEIGEKGINLSGGQKARVSLARAVYSRADVYILDDPLSAVDAHVGKHIFTQVLGSRGLLKTRARILVTNAVQYLASAEQVVMLRDGAIVDQGSFYQVMERGGEIYDFVHRFVKNSPEFGLGSRSGSFSGINRLRSGSDGSNPDSSISTIDSTKESDGNSNVTRNTQDDIFLPPGVESRRRLSQRTLGRASIGSIRSPLSRNASAVSTPTTDSTPSRTMSIELNRQGSVEWNIYRIYIHACGLRNVGVFVAVLVLASVLNILANMWLMHWASSGSKLDILGQFVQLTRDSIVYYLAVYGLLGLFGAMLSLLQSYYLWAKCSVRASAKVHDNLLLGVLRSPMSFFDVTPLGRILNRFSSDVRGCDESLPQSTSSMINSMVSVVSAFVVIAFTTPLMLAFMFPLVFVYRYLQRRYFFSIRELRRLELASKSPTFSHFQETIGGVSTIRAYCQQARFVAENEHRLESYIRIYYAYLGLIRWLSLRLEFLGNFVMLGTTLLSVCMLHYYGYGNAGLVGISVAYALDIISSVNWCARSYTDVENMMIQLERMTEYSKLTPEAPAVIEENRPRESWPEHGSVEFVNYSTRYREDLDLVLRGVSFKVLPKQKVGIVGRTGAGKSSLTLALFRIIEAAGGQILIDGQDISQFGLRDVRSKLSIIPQDPVLFAGTIRRNLDPFGDYSDAEIWNALNHAHLSETIRTKGSGLESEVTQGGDNFSVGQRQLICLARALLKRAKVLVLDEATAAIDNSTDAIIQETIRSEFKECTVLTIAHRLNTVMDSDMILVVDDGIVAEYDTPKSLLKNKDSLFSRLVEEAAGVSSST
ncbi:hypothetical protein GGI15_003253 [Coemansia interrupta]|uniref:Uncharacterized protein n=1 Tax=Coemansia interrupta TaxID=1126814 RepID=A0A9W8HG52_9FUNG|nr:hypothetical protein GGI15_003253 [Coemansia interrupta]